MTTKWLALLFVTGCAVDADLDDVDTETDESEIIYCPDGDCEPVPAPSERADLVPSPLASPCTFIYRSYPQPHYRIGFKITNTGAVRSNIHTTRVHFIVPFITTAPLYLQHNALDPGTSTTTYIQANAYCWNSTPGCDIKVTADYANANTESNESNNTVTWHCAKQ